MKIHREKEQRKRERREFFVARVTCYNLRSKCLYDLNECFITLYTYMNIIINELKLNCISAIPFTFSVYVS